MANQVFGTIKAISPCATIQGAGGRQYVKQSVFLDNGEYSPSTGEYIPNDLLLDFINRREGDLSAQFAVGQRVRVSFRLRGRSWDSRREPGKKEWGISVSPYRIEAVAQAAPAAAPMPAAPAPAQPAAQPAPVQAAQQAQPAYSGGMNAAPAAQPAQDNLPF